MAQNPPRSPVPRVPPARPITYTSVDAPVEIEAPPAQVPEQEEEQRVAITLGVVDGLRFGCGLVLAGVGFGFGLIVVVAMAVIVSSILGIPLPLSGSR
jgi:hypothetical protein